MYMHENKNQFREVIHATYNVIDIRQSIIEKDYYVFLMLKLINSKVGAEIAFKGGTSLSKAYGLINRFSEDIDLCLLDNKIKQKTARARLVDAITSSISDLNLEFQCKKLERHGTYNDIRGNYIPVSQDGSVEPYVKVEVAHRTPEYPYDTRVIDSYVGEYLRDNGIQLPELEPFQMRVVSPMRTMVDKLFAVADYYILGKVTRYSRHIYDLHKLILAVNWNDPNPVFQINELLQQVKLSRQSSKMCPSSQPGINLRQKIYEAITKDYYKDDYNNITLNILYDSISYETCKQTILNLLQSNLLQI